MNCETFWRMTFNFRFSVACSIAVPTVTNVKFWKKEIDIMTMKLNRNINWMLKWTVTFDGSKSDLIRPIDKWQVEPKRSSTNRFQCDIWFFFSFSTAVFKRISLIMTKDDNKRIDKTNCFFFFFFFFSSLLCVFENVKMCVRWFCGYKRRESCIHSIEMKHRFYLNLTNHEKRMDQMTFISFKWVTQSIWFYYSIRCHIYSSFFLLKLRVRKR